MQVLYISICSAAHSAAALAAAAARRAARLEEQHLDNILLSIAHLPHHLPAADHQPDRPSTAAGGRRQLQRCVDLADVATLQQELLHRLGTVGQPLARYTPTCQAICRGVWALAVLQVRGGVETGLQWRAGCAAG